MSFGFVCANQSMSKYTKYFSWLSKKKSFFLRNNILGAENEILFLYYECFGNLFGTMFPFYRQILINSFLVYICFQKNMIIFERNIGWSVMNNVKQIVEESDTYIPNMLGGKDFKPASKKMQGWISISVSSNLYVL